jgi:hypothetical protein
LGCLRRVVSLVVLLVVAAVVWLYWGDDIRDAVGARRAADTPALAGPELSDATMVRIASLAETPGGRIALSEAEVQSLIDHEYATMIPAFLGSPTVRIRDNTVPFIATSAGNISSRRPIWWARSPASCASRRMSWARSTSTSVTVWSMSPSPKPIALSPR